jgi:hypothetical protein
MSHRLPKAIEPLHRLAIDQVKQSAFVGTRRRRRHRTYLGEFGLRLFKGFFNEGTKVLANDRIGVSAYPKLTLIDRPQIHSNLDVAIHLEDICGVSNSKCKR